MISEGKLQQVINETIEELKGYSPDDKSPYPVGLRIRLIWLKFARDCND